MLVARVIVSGLYAALMLFAVFAKYKSTKKIDYLMLIGGVFLLFANFQGHILSLIIATVSLLIIHAAALLNGKSNGKINPAHHLLRLLISVVILILFWFS